MSYVVVYGEHALDGVLALEDDTVLVEFFARLDRLAADTLRFSGKIRAAERFSPSGAERCGKKYRFAINAIGFCVYFYFSADEREIRVYEVSVEPFWLL